MRNPILLTNLSGLPIILTILENTFIYTDKNTFETTIRRGTNDQFDKIKVKESVEEVYRLFCDANRKE